MKLLKKLKKEWKNDILSTKNHIFKIAEYKDEDSNTYYVILNDKWPHLDSPLVNPDPEGRMIVRSYGSTFARQLQLVLEVANSIFKDNPLHYSIHDNDDIVLSNNEYRIRFTKNINAFPVKENSIN